MTEVRETGLRAGDALHAVVEFGEAQGVIAKARDFTAAFLQEAAADSGPYTARDIDAARLVVSELVTNVVKYAPGPCRLELSLYAGTLEISVLDTRPVTPVARPRDPDRLGQHGMEIVLALCDGVETEAVAPYGKRVRARLPLG
ncbi:ATP-binding protein [Streptomyces sp. NPDC093600]|uniref:ATP-binding protein n=1 Tax=Streptomyces sp. NPDC093600 TaxID=3366047 RepID=UPI0037F53B97